MWLGELIPGYSALPLKSANTAQSHEQGERVDAVRNETVRRFNSSISNQNIMHSDAIPIFPLSHELSTTPSAQNPAPKIARSTPDPLLQPIQPYRYSSCDSRFPNAGNAANIKVQFRVSIHLIASKYKLSQMYTIVCSPQQRTWHRSRSTSGSSSFARPRCLYFGCRKDLARDGTSGDVVQRDVQLVEDQ